MFVFVDGDCHLFEEVLLGCCAVCGVDYCAEGVEF